MISIGNDHLILRLATGLTLAQACCERLGKTTQQGNSGLPAYKQASTKNPPQACIQLVSSVCLAHDNIDLRIQEWTFPLILNQNHSCCIWNLSRALCFFNRKGMFFHCYRLPSPLRLLVPCCTLTLRFPASALWPPGCWLSAPRVSVVPQMLLFCAVSPITFIQARVWFTICRFAHYRSQYTSWTRRSSDQTQKALLAVTSSCQGFPRIAPVSNTIYFVCKSEVLNFHCKKSLQWWLRAGKWLWNWPVSGV